MRARVQSRLVNKYINWQDVFGARHLRCPHPERHPAGDQHPSAFVYPNGIYCFGCGWHTDNIIEACKIFLGLSPWTARRRLYVLLSRGGSRLVGEQNKVEPISPRLVRKWMEQRRPQDIQYLCQRYGLSPVALNRAYIGYEGSAFTIPHLGLDGHVWAVKFRRDDRKTDKEPKYWAYRGYGFHYLYPAFALNYFLKHPPDFLLICEGEFDALAALSHNIPALSVPSGGATRLSKWDGVWGALGNTTIYLAFDMDEAGQLARQNAFEYFNTSFPDRLVIDLEWSGGKDIAEVLAKGGRLW